MKEIEQTLDSREVAGMVEKDHNKLLRDIRRYVEQLGEAKIGHSDFFRESTYKSEQNKEIPCYRITKKGCEFIAHKLTGTKGTIFTARYINRFHEMQDILSKQETEPQLPWFIRKFHGKYIMRFEDFETVTGVSLNPCMPFWKEYHDIMNSRCPMYWNGWAWYTTEEQKEAFKREYGFEYGNEPCMNYLYPCGIRKVLQLCMQDKRFILEQSAYDMIIGGLKAIEPPKKAIAVKKPEPITISREYGGELPMQVNIIFGNRELTV